MSKTAAANVVEDYVVVDPEETRRLEKLMRESVADDPFIKRVASQLETLPTEEYAPPMEAEYNNLLEIFPEVIEIAKQRAAERKAKKAEREYTGLSVSYYQVPITHPTTAGRDAYTAECNDIIEALGMTFAEGNIFKAIWRMCAARQGKQKQGYRDALYDAEKVVFFGQRIVEQVKRRSET